MQENGEFFVIFSLENDLSAAIKRQEYLPDHWQKQNRWRIISRGNPQALN